jgi:hypothetical protein
VLCVGHLRPLNHLCSWGVGWGCGWALLILGDGVSRLLSFCFADQPPSGFASANRDLVVVTVQGPPGVVYLE